MSKMFANPATNYIVGTDVDQFIDLLVLRSETDLNNVIANF